MLSLFYSPIEDKRTTPTQQLNKATVECGYGSDYRGYIGRITDKVNDPQRTPGRYCPAFRGLKVRYITLMFRGLTLRYYTDC